MSKRERLDLGLNAAAIALGIVLLCISCALWFAALNILLAAPGLAKIIAVVPASLGFCFSGMAITPLRDGLTGWWKQ